VQCQARAATPCIWCRVTYIPDTKVANAATFEIQREDHTVGDPLVMQLHEDPTVAFAAYKIPHPLEHRLLIKVKTSSAASAPTKVYDGAIDALTTEIRSIKEQFQDRVREVCGDVDFEPHEGHQQPAGMALDSTNEFGEGMYGAAYGEDQMDAALAFD
jgi:DNA-directed RNA polymerase II subunit RPB11